MIATGFGHIEPRLKLVDRSRAAAEDDGYRHPQALPKTDNGRPRWGREREAARAGSMEVPAFLRRQMD